MLYCNTNNQRDTNRRTIKVIQFVVIQFVYKALMRFVIFMLYAPGQFRFRCTCSHNFRPRVTRLQNLNFVALTV